jgi:predicted small secreted protein
MFESTVKENKMLRKVILALLLASVMLAFCGCGTVQGIGDDLNWLGKTGSDIIEPKPEPYTDY